MGKQTMGTPAQALKHRGDNKLYRLQVSAHGSHTKNTLQGSKVERNSRYFHKIHWLTCYVTSYLYRPDDSHDSVVSLTIFLSFLTAPGQDCQSHGLWGKKNILKWNVTLLHKSGNLLGIMGMLYHKPKWSTNKNWHSSKYLPSCGICTSVYR